MIPVTKPFLPPIEEYNTYVKGIWNRNWLTNGGPLVNELEMKVKGISWCKSFVISIYNGPYWFNKISVNIILFWLQFSHTIL